MKKDANNGTGDRLGWFLQTDILPKVDPEAIYTDPAHNFQKNGHDKWRGGCPWHDSKSGSSFVVTPSLRLWFCAGCGKGGGPVQYLHYLRTGRFVPPRGQDFIAILKDLAQMAGVELPECEMTPEQLEAYRQAETRRAIL